MTFDELLAEGRKLTPKQQRAELKLLLEHPGAPALLATLEQWQRYQADWAAGRDRAGTMQAAHALGAYEALGEFLKRLRVTHEANPKAVTGPVPEGDPATDENWTQGI